MTITDKLKQIIEKAVKNGWGADEYRTNGYSVEFASYPLETWGISITDKSGVYGNDILCAEVMLFDHDFAKAYWGDENSMSYTVIDNSSVENGPEIYWAEDDIVDWQFHLQQCVVSDNPITYYYEHI